MPTKHIKKRHNVNLVLYHAVFPVKYRKKMFSEKIANTLTSICKEISHRYEIHFVEIGTDEDHVHFLIQSVPILSPTQIVTTTKSITAKQLFIIHPELRKELWGGNFWTSGYYINTVGQHGNEETIRRYVQNQGQDYKKLYRTDLHSTLF